MNQKRLPSETPRLLVLGLDGATWNLINPMMQSNELPVIQRLIESGSKGVLESLDPMESPNLWTSIATGMPSDRHGINGYFCTRADLHVNRVWDIAHRHGLQVGLFSWLVTWPPRDPFAFIIPSWMAHSPEARPFDYACIQELYLEQSRYGGEVHPIQGLWQCIQKGARWRGAEEMARFYWRDRRGFSEEDRLAAKLLSEMRMRADLFIALLKLYRPDVATFTLYGSDKIAHRYWHYMAPDSFPEFQIPADHPKKDAIRDYYRRADEEFGRILSVMPLDCNVLLLSDHGFKADPNAPRQFFLDASQLLQVLDVERIVHHYTIQRQVIIEPVIDDPQLVKTLEEALQSIQFSEDKEDVFRVEIQVEKQIVLRTNFSLSWHEESPILTNPTIEIEGKSYPTRRFFFDRTFSGTHDPKGIILMHGPSIRSGGAIEKADLLDLAPTMLYLLDLPISRELPGRIISEAITEEYRENHAPKYIDSYGDPPAMPEDSTAMPESLLEQLRSLDYIK
ncbi:MAG: alkaline phosphatase family protein [Candidatus Omnitrophica bacterium]|nr:alkaline phosphatase family protein [Candidatus Omnitrophota bacterium]